MIEGLAKEIQRRMERVGVKGSHVTLKVKQRKQGAKPPPKFLGHGSCHNLSRGTDTAGSTPTQDWNTIAHIGMMLLKLLAVPVDDIRGMGIIVSKLFSDKANHIDSEPSSRITSWFGGELARKSADHASSHDVSSLEVSGFTPKNVTSSFSGIEFQRPVTCHVPKRGSLANPTLSQVDMAVLASLPRDIRSEIEDQLGCSNDSMGIGIEEQAIGQQGSPTVLSQCDGDGHSVQTSYTGQNSPFEWNGDDLVLPPFSQIHMSQVAELPSPLRKNIIAKVMCPSTKGPANLSRDDLLQKPVASVDADFGVAERCTDSMHARENGDAPAMRQLSVKRMLKLAAVKSGQDTALSNRLGGSVSLTQLECLPLEMQL